MLLDLIKTYVNERVKTDKDIKNLVDKVVKTDATFAEAERFARKIGNFIAEAIGMYDYHDLAEEELQEIILTLLTYDFNLTYEYATFVMQDLNKKNRISLNPVSATFDKENALGLVKNVKAGYMIEDQIRTYSSYNVDNFQKANMAMQKNAGLRPQIERRMNGETCAFCQKLVYKGDYGGSGMPNNIFTRHRGCDCLVIYTPSKGRYVDVWTKKESTEYREIVNEQRKYLKERNALTIEEVSKRSKKKR